MADQQGNIIANALKYMRNSKVGNALLGTPIPRQTTLPAIDGNPSQLKPFAAPKGFANANYAYGPNGEILGQKTPDSFFAPVTNPKAAQQLQAAGMPAFNPELGASRDETVLKLGPDAPKTTGGLANLFGTEKAQQQIGAVAKALSDAQVNKPKLQQVSPQTAGSRIEAGNYLRDLFAASKLQARGGK